ncbi:hypothetical protein D915_009196 [Fasciola hepatica]|uniref:Uncharacterized protein n=1 Tax=Fasciola hepatica TaxID=6192 RepID=A0A4E0QXK7_FASHE|nr:hypothetical protein D915_009196 [Fasciola hepatica]
MQWAPRSWLSCSTTNALWNLWSRKVHGRCTASVRVSSRKAGERLGFSTKAFSSSGNLSAKQRSG